MSLLVSSQHVLVILIKKNKHCTTHTDKDTLRKRTKEMEIGQDILYGVTYGEHTKTIHRTLD